MAQALINHVAVYVWIWLETTSIGRIAKTISLLLNMHTLLSAFLAYFLDLLDLISLLEVAFFYVFDSALVLLL